MTNTFGLSRLSQGVLLGLTVILWCSPGTTLAVDVTVRITNLAPDNGLFFTPVWLGFHDGSFDLYDQGSPSTVGLERLAEDGDVTALRGEFMSSSAGTSGGLDGVALASAGFPGAPVFDPGESTQQTFNLNPTTNRFFSYASMVIPSNDAFFANGNPLAHALFDAGGNFLGPITITILGSQVLDAGTEVNNEMDAAFFNQAAGNTGLTENGVVHVHPGFINSLGNPGGTPIILGGTSVMPPGFLFDPVLADFTRPGTELARITITPEPGAGLAVAAMAVAFLRLRRR